VALTVAKRGRIPNGEQVRERGAMVEPNRTDPRKDLGLYRDGAALRAVAYLCQHVGGFREKPAAEQADFLQQLGLLPSDSERILALLRAMPQVLRPEFRRLQRRRPETCEIGWQPNVRAPVFYGVQDFDTTAGAPGALRVFYPSVDGAVWDAPFLTGCGGYPLVVFLHGQCEEPNHYTKWYRLCLQLARSGYVVVTPALPQTGGGTGPWDTENPDLDRVKNVVTWMREEWVHGLQLTPSTGIVGHSFGALLGAHVAVTRVAVKAYVSLSGVWAAWPSAPPRPLGALNAPALFAWGSIVDQAEQDAVLEDGSGVVWDEVAPPKHRLVFSDGHHWDYLPPPQSTCGQTQGPCDLVGLLAAAFTATFLSKYMPPAEWANGGLSIPDNLLPPTTELTVEQQFFAGAHLPGLSLISLRGDCSVTHSWETAGGAMGSVTLSGS
jgi:alpha/beta superfamily hydrolase